ncbi:guanine deaminase [Kaistia dalseonensis]|uniref:Guanine deaminase n=1 Tax=Kaistia dalseonensis TaxID=410840 RepID=A0ABU0HA79_9HYPH|nr:guanine deaminase [Kaistia dalseonensis]MCX5496168.1 guanine deaminase [Kaistia dalseonensis]MDQ0438778.1 guanine deaminase [Kaistia dalseonensis]
MTMQAIRGAAITFKADPFRHDWTEAVNHIPDALITIEDGVIVAVGPAAEGLATLGADVPVTHYPDAIICPGFIDAHVHYPQVQMIGAFGEQLLEWLEKYTFVAEQDFADAGHAETVAGVFLRELLRAGTTTAAVYCTVHPHSVDAFFAESSRFNTRMIAGKVMMDRNAPEALRDTVESGYHDSKALIEKWHGKGRQLYCITPRFAPSSSEAQLEAAGRLWREHPGTYVQSHLCENLGEVAWVRELFPERSSYIDVYDHAGLTGPRAIFGHAVHMDEEDFACCHRTGSALAHCPTSNLFLGSGLFKMFEAKRADRPVHVALGTDVGGGTSLSQLQSLNEAYKVAKLGGGTLTPAQGLYLATRGGAEALRLDDRIGSIEPGYEADLIVLDLKATPLMQFRQAYCRDLMETLFVLMTLGDDRAIRATYIAGAPVYDREREQQFIYPER